MGSARMWPARRSSRWWRRCARLPMPRTLARRWCGSPRPCRGRSSGCAWGPSAEQGARARGVIGSLEIGKEADLVAVDPDWAAARGEACRTMTGRQPAQLPGRPRDGPGAWVRGRRLAGRRRRADGRVRTPHQGGTSSTAPARPASAARWRYGDRLGVLRATPRASRGRADRCHGPRGRAGFIDLHCHRASMILADPATSRRSARASRPRSSASTATRTPRSHGARTCGLRAPQRRPRRPA